MSEIAIKAENLSKAYQLGDIGTGTISRDLERWYARIRGKEDPFLRIGETNDRSSKGTSDIVWSLRDLNFEIKQGDAVGVIGRNGAGKSTLLKILSKVTAPTTGRITGKGRIASLLEVGTGFHPELSGKENIFLNGAILGMRKHEIKRKFDEIVDFAGIERYIDTPVKRYSSGMYVRLAFAVAAHLESEILIVDEVLAVGDAEFQKKCLGKMGEVSKGEGRTVLFVSHNMDAVNALCKSGIVLENGVVGFIGDAGASVDYYQSNGAAVKDTWKREKETLQPHFSEISYEILGKQPELTLRVSFKTTSGGNFPPAMAVFGIKGSTGGTIMEAIPSIQPYLQFKGKANHHVCEIELNGFIPGTYTLYAWLGASEAEGYDWLDDVLTFEINDAPTPERTFPYSPRTGFIVANAKLIT
ncbi:MAG: ABC transporter ATP-binding protein [Pedobacter sp.]|nr:ABC transporter ATP-binding protein [Pedobacter sp.]MDQ8053957.1 ABC transporter ATP-binding protein [Pedobacter sp.]